MLAVFLLVTFSQAQVQPGTHRGALEKPLIPQTPLLYLCTRAHMWGVQLPTLYKSLIFSAPSSTLTPWPLVLSCLAWGVIHATSPPLKGSNHVEEHPKAGRRCSHGKDPWSSSRSYGCGQGAAGEHLGEMEKSTRHLEHVRCPQVPHGRRCGPGSCCVKLCVAGGWQRAAEASKGSSHLHCDKKPCG